MSIKENIKKREEPLKDNKKEDEMVTQKQLDALKKARARKRRLEYLRKLRARKKKAIKREPKSLRDYILGR